MLLIIFFFLLIIFTKIGLVFGAMDLRVENRDLGAQKPYVSPPKTHFYPFACIARAYILICLIMASNPLERVGERCSVKPISRMK